MANPSRDQTIPADLREFLARVVALVQRKDDFLQTYEKIRNGEALPDQEMARFLAYTISEWKHEGAVADANEVIRAIAYDTLGWDRARNDQSEIIRFFFFEKNGWDTFYAGGYQDTSSILNAVAEYHSLRGNNFVLNYEAKTEERSSGFFN